MESTMPEIPVTALHNHLQGKKQLDLLSYAEIPSGPCHAQVWTIECKIDGVVKGRGTALQKAHAKQIAAQEALQALRSAASG